MGYLLRMSGEMHDWLTDLHDSDPPAARLVAGALTALLSEGASLGPPLVVARADSSPWPDLAEALDHSYQRALEHLQISRRRAADAATVTSRIRQQLAGLESRAAADDTAGELRRKLVEATEAEQRLTEENVRLQGQADAFRTRKEVLKASYIAAQATAAAQEVLADAGPGGDDHGPRDEESVAAADKIRTIEQEMEQELRAAPWAQSDDLGPAPGLMELRPGAPEASDVSILFAVEPPGTALLLSVLEGRDARREHYDEAVLLSSQLLQSVRAGEAPEAAAHGYDDTPSFLGEFFPGETDEVDAGAVEAEAVEAEAVEADAVEADAVEADAVEADAVEADVVEADVVEADVVEADVVESDVVEASELDADAAALAARHRARTLAELRTHLGLTQAQVAARMNVAPDAVSAIEQAGPGGIEVRTLAGYIEALGGRLEIVADLGGDRVVLR